VLAEQGDVEAQGQLAYKYVIGEGVPKNPVLAWQWYRRAADSGDVLIQYIVGSSYLYGDENLGVIMDRAEAAKWYRRAAEQGEKSVGLGQRELGRLYEKGWGVPKDDVLAYMWYNLAAAKEGGAFSTAAFHRDTLAEQMTPAQIAEAQRLTREWKPKPER
jgi:TPR repeat protein